MKVSGIEDMLILKLRSFRPRGTLQEGRRARQQHHIGSRQVTSLRHVEIIPLGEVQIILKYFLCCSHEISPQEAHIAKIKTGTPLYLLIPPAQPQAPVEDKWLTPSVRTASLILASSLARATCRSVGLRCCWQRK